jgi:hypothetical protein
MEPTGSQRNALCPAKDLPPHPSLLKIHNSSVASVVRFSKNEILAKGDRWK